MRRLRISTRTPKTEPSEGSVQRRACNQCATISGSAPCAISGSESSESIAGSDSTNEAWLAEPSANVTFLDSRLDSRLVSRLVDRLSIRRGIERDRKLRNCEEKTTVVM
mmetsp:Transcript_93574/g.302390  ORF Transcript_93574/g.302390 Transcript_93574/m.302390 type:complete len:109 (+) Transcript_93574:1285-1611(+)